MLVHKISWKSIYMFLRHPVSLSLSFSLSVHSEYLDITEVDMLKERNESNKIEHHTDLYNSDYLVVRRGQEFQVKIKFNRPYKPETDKFAVEFVIGESSILSF